MKYVPMPVPEPRNCPFRNHSNACCLDSYECTLTRDSEGLMDNCDNDFEFPHECGLKNTSILTYIERKPDEI